MTRIIAIILLAILPVLLSAQDKPETLRLTEVIELAKANSIPAIRARHQYLVGHWQYRYFRANYLPIVSLNTTPINFNRTVTQRYDVNQNIDVYLPQRNIHSSANLSLYQRIGLTGGSVFLDSDMGRLQNFGDNPFTTYSVTPLRLGLIQPLFGFNQQKWEKQLEPLAFDLSRKNYISDMEAVSMQALTLYFDLAAAQNDYDIAISSMAIADTLLQIAEERLALGTSTQDDVLELELRQLDSETNRNKASISRIRAMSTLNTFLGLPPEQEISLTVPEDIMSIDIDSDLALNLALKNHPNVLQWEYDKLNADQEAERTDKENRFNAEISASIGLNQSNESLSTAYGDLLDQEQFRVSLNIPLLDWGRREGRFKMAQSQREVVQAEVRQLRVDFEQELRLQVAAFKMKARQIENSRKGRDLAQRRYEITRQRFLFGNVDLLKLTGAIQAQNQAQQQYFLDIRDYWINYYQIRQLTLFDFNKQENIEVDFGTLSDQ